MPDIRYRRDLVASIKSRLRGELHVGRCTWLMLGSKSVALQLLLCTAASQVPAPQPGKVLRYFTAGGASVDLDIVLRRNMY
jgi:hypothetical protein